MLNKYPLWKNLLIIAILVISFILALPNLFGEDPSVQISPLRDAKIDQPLKDRIESTLASHNLKVKRIDESETQLLVRFSDTEDQLTAKDLLASELKDQYSTALNLAADMPRWLSALGVQPMYLGLDLRGGVHFLLEIDMNELIQQLTNSYADTIRSELNSNDITNAIVTTPDVQTIQITLGEGKQANSVRQILERKQGFEALTFDTNDRNVFVHLSTKEIDERKATAVTQNIRTLRNRVNELGVAEPIIQQQGSDRIVVQLPGIQDTVRAKEILGTTATLEFRMVDENSATQAPIAARTGREPIGTKLYFDRDNKPYLLKRQVMLTGDSIVKANASRAQDSGLPVVNITLDSKGADRFSVVTKENIHKPMATVFIENTQQTVIENGKEVKKSVTKEEIANVATIQQQLFSNFQISGIDNFDEANNLAITLSSGALAAPIHIIEERTVGPSAGKDNIQRGMNAAIYGLLMVMVVMAVRYKAFGMIANVALFANLILILATLSLLQATLTLPGIAGIVLSLGMSVDANVLINERIREDLRKGMSPQNAIDSGFGKAFATIMDANLTSLFAAVALFYIGAGPIKGFAITLSIGIITSVFTAVLLNRAIVNLIWGGRRLDKLPVGDKEHLKIFTGETTYNFMKLCKFWVVSCLAVIVVSIGIAGFKGFNYGLDFTGGTEVEIAYQQSIDTETVRQKLIDANIDAASVVHFGSSSEVLISMPTQEGLDTAMISDQIISALNDDANPLDIKRVDFIGSKVGNELIKSGIGASVLAIALILIYIWVRFEWKLAIGSILSTLHDAVFVVAVFVILGLEFDLTSLAAILAVIGYSVNDTVVVLDRIRENFRTMRNGTSSEIVNAAINQTLSRTIMTSATTFLAVFALYIFGGQATESFSLIMLVGIVVGTYSSIFVAAAGALILGLKKEDLIPPVVQKEDKYIEESY